MFRFFARIAIEINKILNPREETQPIQILFQNTHQEQLILLNTNINKLEKESDIRNVLLYDLTKIIEEKIINYYY